MPKGQTGQVGAQAFRTEGGTQAWGSSLSKSGQTPERLRPDSAQDSQAEARPALEDKGKDDRDSSLDD